MDPSRDGGGGLTATGLLCGSCGTELPPNAKFCNECGAPVTQVSRSAEYKQVTVLFADVVRSMDIAAALDMDPHGSAGGPECVLVSDLPKVTERTPALETSQFAAGRRIGRRLPGRNAGVLCFDTDYMGTSLVYEK